VEHDTAKKCVNILFNKEEKEPIIHETERRANKAAKRARQRSVVEEELDDFYMQQGMKYSTFQSTDANIFKVERDGASNQVNIMVEEEEPVTKKAAKRARQRSAKKTTPAKPAPKAAAKKEQRLSDDDSSDEEKAQPTAKKPAAKPAAKAAKTEESSDRDRSYSDEETAPNKADQAQRQSAKQPPDKQPPAKHSSTAARKVYNVLAPETKHTTMETELNRKNQSQEGKIETEEDATEDNTEEEQLNTIGMGWGATISVLTYSVINDDTLTDSTLSDHTRDLKDQRIRQIQWTRLQWKMLPQRRTIHLWKLQQWTMFRAMRQKLQMWKKQPTSLLMM
jgi:hypothetical protein